MLARIFKLRENNTTVRTELLAGVTTFLTMAYIIFLQPAILSGRQFGFDTGMDFGAVTMATCLASALACIIMGFYANYPIALAPGMGENFFFVLSVIPVAAATGAPNAWHTALGVVFVSGILFYLLYVLGIREKIFDAISPSLKNGMAVGIGLFIAFIGFQGAGLIQSAASIIPGDTPKLEPGTLVKLNANFTSPDLLVFFAGLLVMGVLHVRKVRGSILWGILSAAVFAVILRVYLPIFAQNFWASDMVRQSKLCNFFSLPDTAKPFLSWFISAPPSIAPTFCKVDVAGALAPKMIPFIIIFLFMDVFDTIGTLVGIGEQAGFIKDNKLPRARQAMLSDQAGTLIGSVLGTSTVTSYIESAAGVEQGGRTGLTAITVACLFLVAPFFSPVIATIGSYPPITAPALVLVGAMMIQNVRKIDWNDYSESIPAFLTMIGIPLTYSIADGLALGFISYPIIKLFSGRGREVSRLMYVLGIILLLYFTFVRKLI